MKKLTYLEMIKCEAKIITALIEKVNEIIEKVNELEEKSEKE